jgi:hypothetical protein
MDKNSLRQVKNFKYLGCEISYENENVIQQKLPKFVQILGILYNTFKPTPVQNFSKIKVHFVDYSMQCTGCPHPCTRSFIQ